MKIQTKQLEKISEQKLDTIWFDNFYIFNKFYISNFQLQMMDDKQNILKSFQGKKIDESVHVARWGTVNNEDSARNVFQKYAAGSSNTIQNQNTTEILRQQNTYNTQQSQVHEIDTGFKRLKNNQLQMLKELKNQYDVLRNLNIDEKPFINKKAQHINSSSSSVNHVDQPSEEILSASSHRSKQKVGRKENLSRQAQILALQKKQLQMVINNSMRKIEELLHSQMQYKKQIHELKLQVSGRQNTDIQYESMLKTLKKSEVNQHQTIESLKKQHEKSRYQMRQLNQKISALEGQILVKDQQIRRLYEEKRKSQDLIRLQKDRYFNIDIDYKKTKMEYELLQKDKNSQINRLVRQLDNSSGNKTRQLQSKVKRYEQELEVKDKRYNTLLNQLENLKRKIGQQDQEIIQLKASQSSNILDKQKIEDILMNFRDQNDGVSFNRNMNQVLQKLHSIESNQNQYLQQEMQLLRQQLQGLKQNDKPQAPVINVQPYIDRINQLQKNIRLESSEKQHIIDRLKRFQRDYDQVTRRSSQYQKDIQQYEALQTKLRDEVRSLKVKIAQNVQTMTTYNNFRQSKYSEVQKMQEVKVNKQVQSIQRQLNDTTAKYRQKIDLIQNQLRGTKRLADQNDFKSTKATTEMQFRLRMQQNQNDSMISRIMQDMQRLKRESIALRQQYDQYRATTQRKLAERQAQIQSLRITIRSSTDNTKSNVSNIKLEYESLLKSERERYRMEVELLTTQVTSLSKINEKYMLETNKYVNYENQLSCLRDIMRRSIHLSEGVDHLWRVKETEYQNVNQVLRQISSWQY